MGDAGLLDLLREPRHLAEVRVFVVLERLQAPPQQHHPPDHPLPRLRRRGVVVRVGLGLGQLVGTHPHALDALGEAHQELEARRTVLLHALERRPLGRLVAIFLPGLLLFFVGGRW